MTANDLIENLINEGIKLFMAKQYDETIQKLKEALKLIPDETSNLAQQNYIQSWLGLCYFELALQIKEELKAESSQHKDEKIQSSRKYFNEALILLSKRGSGTQLVSSIQFHLRELDFLDKKYEDYFNNKREYIQDKLPENLDEGLKKILASILAVLSISPIELDKPLAHYTNPNVCEKLLGIDPKQENQENIPVHKMRMNSSTYMNDPYEGRSLPDLLGIYEATLENLSECRSHNAFFACFSARVNDLNQFRLYGKVGNTEASGCCLVFNKNGDWIQEPDISASYQHLNSLSGLTGEAAVAETPSENLPLYQIAYIFYREDYTQDDEYDVMKFANEKFYDDPEFIEKLRNSELVKKFGVRLKPISDNNDWHKIRAKNLLEALYELQEHFQNKEKEKSQTNKVALEYIRYLFKDYAFRDEEEFRLLKIEESGSDKVKYCPITHSTYLEYDDIRDKLDEVILGTNYERTFKKLKVEVFRHLLKRKNLNIKVSHSSLPINPAGR